MNSIKTTTLNTQLALPRGWRWVKLEETEIRKEIF